MLKLYPILFEAIIEPKRTNPKTISQLGIQLDKGVDNIKAVYNEALPEEKDYWGRWYHNAKEDVKEIADRYEINFPIMAAVTAVLSPGNKWLGNLLAAERVVKKFKDPALEIKINSYPRNIHKALQILQTGDLGLVTGPKVSVFFKSLVDPDSVAHDLVLDSHAINIWRGIKRNIKQTEQPSMETRQKMVSDYKAVASELGIPVQALQAITWYIWKYTTNPPTVPDVILPVEAKRKAKNQARGE
jgi:hypothetical protein